MGYFCAALIEATRKGTSISGVLESQAKLARKARYDALTAQINKLSTKMAVPLVFFLIAVLVLIFPRSHSDRKHAHGNHVTGDIRQSESPECSHCTPGYVFANAKANV